MTAENTSDNSTSSFPAPRQGPFLIAGLGNPGRDYEKNRHNAGFMLLNRLADHFGEKFTRVESRTLVTRVKYNGERVILIKPQTYMNASGAAVSSLVRFYRVPLDNFLVAYDDVDLPLGILRLRPAGGSAGQKGMQSIIDRLGTEAFPRLRIGTGRPPGSQQAADYVLQDFSPKDQEILEEALDRALDAALCFVRDGLDIAMNRFNPTNLPPFVLGREDRGELSE